jgi:hypothetical protein
VVTDTVGARFAIVTAKLPLAETPVESVTLTVTPTIAGPLT